MCNKANLWLGLCGQWHRIAVCCSRAVKYHIKTQSWIENPPKLFESLQNPRLCCLHLSPFQRCNFINPPRFLERVLSFQTKFMHSFLTYGFLELWIPDKSLTLSLYLISHLIILNLIFCAKGKSFDNPPKNIKLFPCHRFY